MNRSQFDCSLALRILAVCALGVVAGCGRESSRLSVEGHVTFNGAPLPDGKINFTPLPGTPSPTAGATIKDGEFKVPQDKGVRPGKFRVEIRAIRATGKTIKEDLSGELIERKESYIPKGYNDASNLVAEIKAGERNKLEFTLTEK